MYTTIGGAFVFGLLVIILTGFVNYILGKMAMRMQRRLMTRKDARMGISAETFEAMKFIKSNAYEEHFYDKIDVTRERELTYIVRK